MQGFLTQNNKSNSNKLDSAVASKKSLLLKSGRKPWKGDKDAIRISAQSSRQSSQRGIKRNSLIMRKSESMKKSIVLSSNSTLNLNTVNDSHVSNFAGQSNIEK